MQFVGVEREAQPQSSTAAVPGVRCQLLGAQEMLQTQADLVEAQLIDLLTFMSC